ncbi:MAG: TerB family tellurite resistance protein [Rhizobiaceae bacterium]|nr:TerB family tellurite resistance protein [Rhizobiaceae bacterium]
MFEIFREFIRSIGADGAAGDGFDGAENDPRIAAAALLFHVGEADGTFSKAELATAMALLAEEFGLDESETARVFEAGREADQDAVDLFRFTNVLLQHLDEERRIGFIEVLWEVTYADGEVHELEDNTIWRIAELLGVSTRDRMLMKREAAERSGAEG